MNNYFILRFLILINLFLAFYTLADTNIIVQKQNSDILISMERWNLRAHHRDDFENSDSDNLYSVYIRPYFDIITGEPLDQAQLFYCSFSDTDQNTENNCYLMRDGSFFSRSKFAELSDTISNSAEIPRVLIKELFIDPMIPGNDWVVDFASYGRGLMNGLKDCLLDKVVDLHKSNTLCNANGESLGGLRYLLQRSLVKSDIEYQLAP